MTASAPAKRRRVRGLLLALAVLLLGAAAVLGWHWEALAPRSWPEDLLDLQLTDDGAAVVTLDADGVLRLHDRGNPFDRLLGGRPRAIHREEPHRHGLVRAISPRAIVLSAVRPPGSFRGSVPLRGRGTSLVSDMGEITGETEIVSLDPPELRVVSKLEPVAASAETDVLIVLPHRGHAYAVVEARRLSDPAVKLWSSLPVHRAKDSPEQSYRGAVALSPDGARLAVVRLDWIGLFDARSGALLTTIPTAWNAAWVGFDETGELLAYFQETSRVERYARDGTPLGGFLVPGMARDVSSEGHVLLVQVTPSTSWLLDSRTGREPLRPISWPCRLSRDGTRVVFGSRLQIVDVPR